jgi:hypothetical protein
MGDNELGCPRNNQIFFSVRTETNRNSICFGCFLVCFAKPKKNFFGLFRCFGPVSKQPKQTETTSQQCSIRISSKQLIFFGSNRNSICFSCFSVCFFRETPPKNFRFVSVFRTGIETTETNRTYGMGN